MSLSRFRGATYGVRKLSGSKTMHKDSGLPSKRWGRPGDSDSDGVYRRADGGPPGDICRGQHGEERSYQVEPGRLRLCARLRKNKPSGGSNKASNVAKNVPQSATFSSLCTASQPHNAPMTQQAPAPKKVHDILSKRVFGFGDCL